MRTHLTCHIDSREGGTTDLSDQGSREEKGIKVNIRKEKDFG